MGSLSRVVKKAFREEMSKSYVRFSVSRGFEKNRVLLTQAYKPVVCHLLSAITGSFATVFGGSTVLEFAFGIPGISFFLVNSMKNADYAVLQTYILVVVIWMCLIHVMFQILLYRLDVRRRK